MAVQNDHAENTVPVNASTRVPEHGQLRAGFMLHVQLHVMLPLY